MLFLTRSFTLWFPPLRVLTTIPPFLWIFVRYYTFRLSKWYVVTSTKIISTRTPTGVIKNFRDDQTIAAKFSVGSSGRIRNWLVRVEARAQWRITQAPLLLHVHFSFAMNGMMTRCASSGAGLHLVPWQQRHIGWTFRSVAVLMIYSIWHFGVPNYPQTTYCVVCRYFRTAWQPNWRPEHKTYPFSRLLKWDFNSVKMLCHQQKWTKCLERTWVWEFVAASWNWVVQ